MTINWKFWQKKEEEPSQLTITDGRYGRLEHLLVNDPDGFGWKGRSLEEMHQLFHMTPAERYGFHDLTLEDFNHAVTQAYKENK